MTQLSPAQLAADLIRFDTTNPPGNETECVLFVKRLLESAGAETWTGGARPERLNLVARIPGAGQAPPLLLQGHVDVVTTANQSWRHDPFGGEVEDGVLWGRGAIDMKGGVAMMVAAALRFGEAGTRPPGDLVVAVVADEEAGGGDGAAWLAENHPELFTGVRHAIGEGGGFATTLFGKRFYPIMVAEKRGSPVRLTFRGAGGHASRPFRGGAMAKLGRAITALDSARLPVHLTAATRMMIEGIAAAVGGSEAQLLGRLLDPETAGGALGELGEVGRRLEPALRNSANATMVAGGLKINVIPSQVTLDVDCRLLPGQTAEELIGELREVVGDEPEIEVLRQNPVMPEPELGEFFDQLCDVIRDADSGATPIPQLVYGGTDARHFARLGIRTYGFLPHNWDDSEQYESRMHDADERVPVSSLDFGTRCIHDALTRYRG